MTPRWRRRLRRLWLAAAILAAPWLIEWAVTRRPPVPVNLPHFVRPQIGRLST